jgi:FAD/FMN-containing dehydrogenase/Fe-S oxidoreductase
MAKSANSAPQAVAADLAKLIRGNVYADIFHRICYANDASIYQVLPLCVVEPRGAPDVSEVVKYAADRSIPVAARGSGSGVAGESLCRGIVLATGRYMNGIVATSGNGAAVTCEPAVILDELNGHLAAYGRMIGPDPSTGNRATIGGCVANNSTGAHGLRYGYMGDYVEAVEAVLADGTVCDFSNGMDPSSLRGERAGSIARRCASLLSGSGPVIERTLGAGGRNRSGYTVAGIYRDGLVDMAKIFAGSEGTLGILTRVTVRTVPVPAAKALLELEFDSLEKMASAVPVIVEKGAAACDLMDGALAAMAAESLPRYRDIVRTGAAMVLLVEQTGSSAAEAAEKIAGIDAAVGPLASARRIVAGENEQERLWRLRKDAVPLLYRTGGRKRPVPFIEDVTVPNDRLGEYIPALEKIFSRYGLRMCFYGHAGDGELHVRPYLDLSDPADVGKMISLANEVFSLAWSLGGAISGEHADGLVRAAFLRRQYGGEFYDLLRRVKEIFDPHNIINPGKVINDGSAEELMSQNLKARKVLPERLAGDGLFDESELAEQIDRCSGCGLCISRDPELRMCPVFRAVGEEAASSRSKANMVRFWATGRLREEDFESPQFKKFMDLCVNCKACSVQCPSGVDASLLVSFARSRYVQRMGLGRAEALLARNRRLSAAGSLAAPLSNYFVALRPVRWVLSAAGKLAPERRLPRFERGSFLAAGRRFLAAGGPLKDPAARAAYFVDTYANYNDHELGYAVLGVLRYNNIDVVLPKQRPVPLPAMVYGHAAAARRDLRYNCRHLAESAESNPGLKIVCSEPSAALALKMDLKHFVGDSRAALVAKSTVELMEYLLELFRAGRLRKAVNALDRRFIYHRPCHMLARGPESPSVELLRKMAGAEIDLLEAGCCGLAGTFGMQREKYALSMDIARPLAEALKKAPTRYVLTECAACKMQIEHISDCIVTHPVKVVAGLYGLD